MTGFFRRWNVLRVRNFRNLFLGQAISAFGDGLTPVAITFAVLQMTGSATDLGIVLAAQITPLATLALVAGVWGDRLRREWVMLVSDGVRACSQGAVAFLLLTDSARIWELVVLLAAYGAAQAFFVPAAGALTPQLVAKSDVQAANAVLGFAYGVGLMVGPAVAGALIAVIGPGGAVAIDAATFVVKSSNAVRRSMAASQGRFRTSRQPSRSSARNEVPRRTRPDGATRSAARKPAHRLGPFPGARPAGLEPSS